MNEVVVWILLAAAFILLATLELVRRRKKGARWWPALKEWLVKLFDTLSGG
jgi:hypothetical protein